jgi:DNA (cytosine-5)-methyltransferase 1
MRKVSSSDTKPELILRQALQAEKLRYRVNNFDLPGKPDLVFPKARVAVFVDGDFWHGGQWRKRKLAALEDQFTGNKNKEYWLKKIRRNMDRDCMVTADLIGQGWTVIRFWERDIEKRLEECVRIIVSALAEDWALLGSHPLTVIPRRTVAEFFAGMGFMRMGLEKEGWTVAFATEPEPEKWRMYESRFGKNERFSEGDIHQISGGVIPEVTLAAVSFSGNDVLLGADEEGLPGKRSSAFEFIRIIGEMRGRKPPFILLENGVGFLSSDTGNDFKFALGALSNLGYQVDAFILDTASFTPVSRKSLFILGVLAGFKEAEFPTLLMDLESEVRPKPLMEFIMKHPEIRWGFRELPCPKRKISLGDIVEEVPENSDLWWSAERAGYLFSQMSPQDQAVAVRVMNQDEYRYGMVIWQVRSGESMVELYIDKLSGCLASSQGSEQILLKVGKGKYFVRGLTPREYIRLMGADGFQITDPVDQDVLSFGDAARAPVIQWIARYYLNPLVTELLRGKTIRPEFGNEGC